MALKGMRDILSMHFAGYFIFMCYLDHASTLTSGSKKAPKIAIIGGGIGGTSCAYTLRQALGANVSLTLFEMGELGGRMATVEIGGLEYESGGSIIHSQNQEMAAFVKTLGLKAAKKVSKFEHWTMSSFTLFGANERRAFHLTDWTFFQDLQMVWRYGLTSLYQMNDFTTALLESFLQLYPKVQAGLGFSSTAELLGQTENLMNGTTWSLSVALQSAGLDQLLIHELVTAAVRVNYGQIPSQVHALVGGVALAGADGNLWAIHGGNKQVPEALLNLSGAAFRRAKVESVALRPDGRFEVAFGIKLTDKSPFLWSEGNRTSDVNEYSELNRDQYDMVVLATPMTEDKRQLDLLGFPNALTFPGSYHRCVATFVAGHLNARYFDTKNIHLVSPNNFYLEHQDKINSISLLFPVNYKTGMKVPQVWKIFSQSRLSDEELDRIFRTRSEVKVVDWLAYPDYKAEFDSQELGQFVLHPGLYHINAIEWAASAMEMSALGARNVANLIIQELQPNLARNESKPHWKEEL
eukprot:maker-scaffold106_size358372-snap-gene-2.30 protein:Tk03541 transcript:maker-scaffold106_size358372-snap-gene-2.30-mRNA-1 annotation:"prenylcysteine oxidase"